jgi:hypothetical protein
MLTKAQRRALFLEMHRSIEEAASRAASGLVSSHLPSPFYPPNAGLTEEEAEAVQGLMPSPALENALRKLIASAASEPLQHLLCILDGITDPVDYDGLWLGARIEPVEDEPRDAQDDEALRYEFMDHYWEWRCRRPDPGWRLDICEE